MTLVYNIYKRAMKNLLFILLVFCAPVFAQDLSKENEVKLTGILSLDSKQLQTESLLYPANQAMAVPNKKSPVLAGVLSLALPGAGEFYSESYLKSAIFLAVEAAAITIAVSYDKKGDNQTTEYEKFAQAHWDVKKYAADVVNQVQQDPEHTASELEIYDGSGNVIWSKLNYLEEKYSIGSHKLDPYGTQQYYEMIGKYNQFHAGWAEDGLPDSQVMQRINDYMGQRAEANDLYSVASTFVKILVANHFISALDAAWSASRYNKRISLSLQIDKASYACRNELNPRLNISYAF